MKVKLQSLLIICFCLLLVSQSYATILRVSNIPGSNATYTSVSTALNAAVEGDTIHVEPSPSEYSGVTISKKIVLIGNGCFLDEHSPSLQANTNTSKINGISLNSGSEESLIMGLDISNVTIRTDSVRIERNYIGGGIF